MRDEQRRHGGKPEHGGGGMQVVEGVQIQTYLRREEASTQNVFFVKLSINGHIVGLVHKNHIINEI